MRALEREPVEPAPTAGWPESDVQRPVPRTDPRWFRHELTPTWLATASLLAGSRPPDLTRPFRFAWFGCRSPFNPAVVAAVHPNAEVLAWDPDPINMVAVRSLRVEAELSNLVLHEQPHPPSSVDEHFDIVVLDGLVDAVDGERRTELIATAASQLRPGGLLCITYRTVVGWGEIVPIVRLLRHAVHRTSRDVAESVEDALVLLEIFRERNVGYQANRPMVRAWVDALLKSGVDEVAAEYVRRDLCPTSHAQIDDVLTSAGASFVGSALLDDDLPEDVPKELAALVRTAPSRVLRESLTDLLLRRSSRADLFTLGGPMEAAAAHTQRIKRLSLTAFGADPYLVDVRPDLSLTDQADAQPALGRLTSRCRTTGELWAGVTAQERQRMFVQTLRTGGAHPVRDGELNPEAVAASARLTRILEGTGTPKPQRHIVTPLVGSAVPAGIAMDRAHLRYLQGRK